MAKAVAVSEEVYEAISNEAEEKDISRKAVLRDWHRIVQESRSKE